MRKTCSLIIIVLLFIGVGSWTEAATEAELTTTISTKQAEITKLEADIKAFQSSIAETQKKAGSLQDEIKEIDLTRQKLTKDITLTQKKIDASRLTLQKLRLDIADKSSDLARIKEATKVSLRQVQELDTLTPLVFLLSGQSWSEVWIDIAHLGKLSNQLITYSQTIIAYKNDLEYKENATKVEASHLTTLGSQLTDQKSLADTTKKAKDTLLTNTKNQQSTYQLLLADRLLKKQKVESEIAQAEAALRTIIDPSKLPSTGKGILAWPVTPVIITQYFGNTAFASQNSQVYNGKGHNGIDLGVPVGTAVGAAAEGVVTGTGNTDLTCAGASYGRWVLIKHFNGLSTLYAHLSLIKVAEGESVSRGGLLGYSGNTGYSTGPHLHFSLFASQGVSVGSLQSKVSGCGVYRLPLASYNSYLNPLSYL
ncbi:MAG: peptidoglycan DD-metalloendopeptidase family protein [Candidatus Vogelbacteria bacterium]|nr:peptidoglycan DD-metalloendopeptidase family protein [Candidatus Vogelbacteria bacterium]